MGCIKSVCSCTSVCTLPLHTFVIFACMEILHHSALTKQDQWNKRQEAAVPSDSQLSMALMTKDNCRQKNVHTVERSWAIIHRGLEARNKCPYVIDYTLQANEINRAWIDSDESCQRDVRSRVQRLCWHAHIQRASERDQSVLLVANRAVSFPHCTDLLHPPPQSGSVLLKSNASNRIWQAGDSLLRHHCWENLSFVKDKQHPGCEARTLTLETHSSSAFR